MGNLKGIDILVLHYLNYNSSASDLHQLFWKDRYFVNPKDSLIILNSLDLFEYKKDAVISLNKLTLPELKDILRNNTLKLTGKKQDLISRIINEAESITYSTHITETIVVTDLGKELLSKFQFILDIHKFLPEYSNPNAEYMYYLNNPELSSLELICSYIENDMQLNNGYGLGYSPFTLHKLAKLCIKEDAYVKAIDYLIEACYESIHYDEVRSLFWNKFDYDYFKSRVSIPPVFIETLSLLLSTQSETLPYFDTRRINYKYTDEFFSKSDVSDLIINYINKDLQKIDTILFKYYELALSRANNRDSSSHEKIQIQSTSQKKVNKNGCLIPFLLIFVTTLYLMT